MNNYISIKTEAVYDTRFHFVVNIQYITVKITGLDVVKCNNVNKKTVVPNVN